MDVLIVYHKLMNYFTFNMFSSSVFAYHDQIYDIDKITNDHICQKLQAAWLFKMVCLKKPIICWDHCNFTCGQS